MDVQNNAKPTLYQRDAMAAHAPYITKIEKYWWGRGQTHVKAWSAIKTLTFYSKFDQKVITIDAVEICTNLVNGSAPEMRT